EEPHPLSIHAARTKVTAPRAYRERFTVWPPPVMTSERSRLRIQQCRLASETLHKPRRHRAVSRPAGRARWPHTHWHRTCQPGQRQLRVGRSVRSGDLNPVVPDDVFDRHVSADSLEVVADGADLGAVEVPALDL